MSIDPNWTLARSIQISLTTEPLEPRCSGVVRAYAHPTGWFVSARVAPGLAREHAADFREFVAVRVYLLLTEGPRAGRWERAGAGEWQAHCVAAEQDLALTA